jgi:PAS domain S-box-containing protein
MGHADWKRPGDSACPTRCLSGRRTSAEHPVSLVSLVENPASSANALSRRLKAEAMKKKSTPAPKASKRSKLTKVPVPVDITGHQRTEAALREREEQLRLYAEHSPAAVALFDRDMKYLVVSRRWREDYWLGDQSIIGRSHYEVFPDVPPRWVEIHRRCLAGAVEKCDEDSFPHADGTTDWIRWEVRPWHQADGAVGGIIIFSEDITARKQAEEALARERNLLRMMLDLLPDYIYFKDEQSRFVICNNRPADDNFLPGTITANDLIGKTDADFYPAGQAAQFRADELAVLGGTPLIGKQETLTRHDGSLQVILTTKLPFRDSSGKITGLLGYGRDITARKQAEEALEKARADLERAQAISHTGSWEFIVAGARIKWSDELYRIFGLEPQSVTINYDRLVAMIHPEDRDRHDAYNVKMLAAKPGENIAPFEYRVQRPDGRTAHVLVEVEVCFDAQGQSERWFGTVQDITGRKEAELARRRERDFSEAVLNSLPGVVYCYDRDFRFVRWNKNFERVLGYTAEEVARMSPLDFFAAPDKLLLAARIQEVFDRGASDVEADFLTKDGRRLPYYFTGVTAQIDGQPHLVGVGIDISERKQAEEKVRQLNAGLERRVAERTAELAVARDRAEAADQVKSMFLATMSHELRTPLNSIIGFTGIILQGLAGTLNPEQSKQLKMVQGSARHLLALINDVLDLSKIEAKELKVTPAPFDLRATLERAVATIRPFAETKRLALRLELSPAIGELVSDVRRVEQILLNLLNNAVKFTERGTVSLTADVVGANVRLRITDTGIGIKPEDLANLFQPFQQVENGMTRSHDGTGLGLVICRRLAGLLGGEIQVASEAGRGSTFTVLLPLHPTPKT